VFLKQGVLNGYFQGWKSHWKKKNPKSFGKVMDHFLNIYMLIYALFEIIMMLLKERRSKFKQAYVLHFLTFSHFFIKHQDFTKLVFSFIICIFSFLL